MHKRDKFLLGTTFVFGFFCGFYLYLVGFSPNYSIDLESLRKNDFIIVGDRYGGCEMVGNCAAFQIIDNGSYRYVPETLLGQGQRLVEGELPKELYAPIEAAIVEAPLEDFAALVEPVSCASFADGQDTLYTITIDTDEYSLDTCGTKFSTDSELGSALEAVWQYLESQSQ